MPQCSFIKPSPQHCLAADASSNPVRHPQSPLHRQAHLEFNLVQVVSDPAYFHFPAKFASRERSAQLNPDHEDPNQAKPLHLPARNDLQIVCEDGLPEEVAGAVPQWNPTGSRD
jgi:hypothetical protein